MGSELQPNCDNDQKLLMSMSSFLKNRVTVIKPFFSLIKRMKIKFKLMSLAGDENLNNHVIVSDILHTE